jgi:hypothetical protein
LRFFHVQWEHVQQRREHHWQRCWRVLHSVYDGERLPAE